eukprot:TRINITY_DN31376_c0_g1_i1.p1 TRINITY_DN31376_c0_g1~~TRINITY_DN31376_c0_g1_i1.p1  ORF type:complete len:481 (-),score=101.84 TRINITY_DN31376_c0_g1_i1:148-1416(-)
MVTGEVIDSQRDMLEAKGALVLDSLANGVEADHLVPSFCCIGAAALMFRRFVKGSEASKSQKESDKSRETNEERARKASVSTRPGSSDDLFDDDSVDKARGCCTMGIFDEWTNWFSSEVKDEAKKPEFYVSLGDDAETQAYVELRNRLSDLLGAPSSHGIRTPPAVDKALAAQAQDTIQRFGGEESCLHRFLKAKSLNVDAAEKKLRKTIEWRISVNANDIHEEEKALRIAEFMRPVWPEKIVGTTSQGCPISFFDVGQAVRTCQMDVWNEENVQSFYVTWMEYSLQLQREGRQQYGPIGSGNNMPPSVVVYNLKDLKLGDVMHCVSGLKAMVKILAIIEEHYPENLHKAIIINVPSIFYRFVWPLVQQGLDKNTLGNIHLSEDEGRPLLVEFLGIDEHEVEDLLTQSLRDRSASSVAAEQL